LRQYDYGARFYDPVIARWNVIDPMAENHYNVNPYNYVLNNPLIYYDQYGLDTGKVNPAPAPVHQLKEVTITAKKESKASGFGLAALGIASRVKNVPKWLWVTDTFDQEVPVLDVLTDALTLYYLSKDIKPAIVKSSPAIPDAKDLPWDKGKSPGEDWTWKGKGDAESGKGNWVNDKTGQKLHPDFDHPDPKGPHWGLQQPDGEKYDIFPNGNVEPNNK
jgi:hypothetical protein